MKKRGIDALLLTNLENIRYASGFTGSTAIAVVTMDSAVILVDSRYILQATAECTGFEPKLISGDALKAACELINELKPEKVGFEADYITYNSYKRLRPLISKEIKITGVTRTIEDLRIVKDAGEIAIMKKAVKIADDCFTHLLSTIKVGMTERDVALEIFLFMYKKGAKLAFDSIVAAGPDAAFPHFQPSDAVLKTGQMVKLDFGANTGGYNSDITRTVFLGEPDPKQREVYNTVLEAQLAAIAATKPGKKGKEVDAVAREYIASKGYGAYFGHGLGHSLGMGVHDGPGLAPSSETVLAPGMVMTVEPGIYIEGWGGVRIEDDVVITEDGCEILTKSTKEIVVIK
jgi:Xaa-Pro aminopeptidase